MTDADIGLYLLMNEPAFTFAGKQYSVCSPDGETFCTWDSDGNTADFGSVSALLDGWFVADKPFRAVVKSIM